MLCIKCQLYHKKCNIETSVCIARVLVGDDRRQSNISVVNIIPITNIAEYVLCALQGLVNIHQTKTTFISQSEAIKFIFLEIKQLKNTAGYTTFPNKE